jgi:hypothetical protein
VALAHEASDTKVLLGAPHAYSSFVLGLADLFSYKICSGLRPNCFLNSSIGVYLENCTMGEHARKLREMQLAIPVLRDDDGSLEWSSHSNSLEKETSTFPSQKKEKNQLLSLSILRK